MSEYIIDLWNYHLSGYKLFMKHWEVNLIIISIPVIAYLGLVAWAIWKDKKRWE